MRHIFEHAKRAGFRTSLRVTPEIVLRAPAGGVVPHRKAIEFLRELASLDVEYRATFRRGKRGFVEVAITPLGTVGSPRRKHARFHRVWNFLLAQGHRPVRVR